MWEMPQVIKNPCYLFVHVKERLHEEGIALFFHKKEKGKWERKEKQESEIGGNLSLGKRKKEKRFARRKSSPDLKGKSPDRLR
jgi:hypothetical protein